MTNNQNPTSLSLKNSSFGKASAFASVKGSITLEAAMAVPIFFLSIICLLYLMEIMAVQTSVRAGLQYAGKIAAQESYPLTVIIPQTVESNVVNAIGAERLERSIVMDGSTGIDCSRSRMSVATGIGEVAAEYKIKVPISVFRIPPLTYQDSIKIKAWTGYEKGGFGLNSDKTVYVTETGLVYHKDYHCTHLELSIHMVASESVGSLRNESGGKYYACTSCKGGSGGGVYITNSGDRYHSSLSCSGLKRTVYAVPQSEVVGKGACARCGQ